jgi:hypothetical protein
MVVESIILLCVASLEACCEVQCTITRDRTTNNEYVDTWLDTLFLIAHFDDVLFDDHRAASGPLTERERSFPAQGLLHGPIRWRPFPSSSLCSSSHCLVFISAFDCY